MLKLGLPLWKLPICTSEENHKVQCCGCVGRRTWNKKIALWAATLFTALCVNVPAWAGPVLTVPIRSGGTVIYDGRGEQHRALGFGIRLGEFAFGSDVLRLFGGRLFFAGEGSWGSHDGNRFWQSGGRLALRGCADLNHDAKCGNGDFRGTLMTATVANVKLIEQNGHLILEARIIEHLNPELAALLNLSDTRQMGELELTLVLLCKGKWWERYSIISGSLGEAIVPEPASFWLLSASLTFLVGSALHRARASK